MRDSTGRGVKRISVNAAIQFGIIFFIVACEKEECVSGQLNVTVERLGGHAYSNQWVLPVQTDVIQSGWWSNASFQPAGDTAFTDDDGKVTIQLSGLTDGFLFQSTGMTKPYFVNFPLNEQVICSNSISIPLPNFIYFKFIGNRDGDGNNELIVHPSGSVLWDTNPNWFTPGSSPRPFLIFKDWIHPDETSPIQRSFNLFDSEGTFLFQHQVLIPINALEDTMIIPIP